MNDSDVLIKILTSYESGGLEAAKKAAEELKKEVADNSSASETLGSMMKVLEGNGRDAGKVLGGLAETMNKGSISAGSLSKAVQGLGGIFGTSLGGIGAIVGTAVAAFTALKQAHDEEIERLRKLDEEEKKAQQAADDAVKAILDLDKIRLDSARGEVQRLREQMDALDKAASEVRNRLDSIEDAQLGVELAQIDARVASGEIDSEEAEWLKANRRAESAKRKDQRELSDLEEEESRLGQAAQTTADAAAEAADALEAARAELAAAEQTVAKRRKYLNSPWVGPLAYNDGKRALDAALQARQDAAEKVANASTAEAAASAAAEEAQSRLNARRPGIEARRAVLSLNQQARDFGTAAADSRRDAHIRQELAREQANQEAAAEAARKKEAENRRQPTLRDYYGAAWNAIGRGQRDATGQLYDIDGGATQKAAREAMAEVARSMAEGKAADDEAAKAGLKQRLDEMGAVYDERRLFGGLQKAVDLRRHPSKGKGGADDDGSRILVVPENAGPTMGGLSRSIGANIQDGRMVEGSPFAQLDGGKTRNEAWATIKDSVNSAAQAVAADGNIDAGEIAAAARGIVEGIQAMGANVQSFAQLFTDINAAITLQAQKISTLEQQVKNGRGP